VCTPAVTYWLILHDTQQSGNASDGHTKTDFFHSNQPTVAYFSEVNQVSFKYVLL